MDLLTVIMPTPDKPDSKKITSSSPNSSNASGETDQVMDSVPAVKLRRNLSKMQKTGELCDVTIHVGGQEFQAHACVLAASCGYFETLFTSFWLETELASVQLSTIKPETFAEILRFVYDGRYIFTPENIFPMYEAADYLDNEDLVQYSLKYLKKITSPKNSLRVLELAEKFSIESLCNVAEKVILSSFKTVSEGDSFLDMQKRTLARYLQSDDLYYVNEYDLFTSVVRWLEHDTERLEHVYSLCKNIRYGLMNSPQLQRVHNTTIVMENNLCQDMLLELLEYRTDVYSQPLNTSRMSVPRSPLFLTVAPYILPTKGPDHKVFVCEIQKNGEDYRVLDCKRDITPKPVLQTFCLVVTVNNFLFTIGGVAKGNPLVELNCVLRYCTSMKQWLHMKPLNFGRFFAKGAPVLNKIFVIGGQNAKNPLKNAEIYDISSNTWEVIKPEEYSDLNYNSKCIAVCAHASEIFMSGGGNGSRGMYGNYMFKFDFQKKDWKLQALMKAYRVDHSMCSNGEKIIIYGMDCRNSKDEPIAAMVEEFDPVTRQCTTIAELPASTNRFHECLYHPVLGLILLLNADFGRKTLSLSYFDQSKKVVKCIGNCNLHCLWPGQIALMHLP